MAHPNDVMMLRAAADDVREIITALKNRTWESGLRPDLTDILVHLDEAESELNWSARDLDTEKRMLAQVSL